MSGGPGERLDGIVGEAVFFEARRGSEEELEPALSQSNSPLEPLVDCVRNERQVDIERRVGAPRP